MVFMAVSDPLVEARFLSLARERMAGTRVDMSLRVSHRAVFEKVGPLGKA